MKTAVIVVLAAFVACASADCDALTRLKVKYQWRRAYSSGSDRENFAQALWRATFAQAPEARQMFSRVGGDDTNSAKFKAHAERVLAGLDITINLLDQPEALKAELEHLHEQHQGRNIPDKYFYVFRSALGHVLPAQLGRCWDKDAWKACFNYIAHGITGADFH
jgi:hemoglobin-like flavoprotein